jgi:signal transduction histidine kinase
MDQCLDMILGQVRLLRQIASEFSNFAGEPTPRPEAVDLAQLLDAVIGPYRQGLASRVTFENALPEDLPPVWADPTLLARAFTNLVENAVQAMPDQGRLLIQGEAGDAHLTLRLIDTGVGMDDDAVARAFEPFFSTKTGGSGLGLANARRNLEIGGGSVTIASVPGRGTTVTVTLPLASVPGSSVPGPAPSR